MNNEGFTDDNGCQTGLRFESYFFRYIQFENHATKKANCEPRVQITMHPPLAPQSLDSARGKELT